jgi:hypothetical protein
VTYKAESAGRSVERVLAATLSAHGSATLDDHRTAVLHEDAAGDANDEA